MRVHRVHGANKVKRAVVYFKWSIIIIIFGSFYAWQRIKSRKLGYRISEINGRILSLAKENKYLTMKIMDITAMNNLEEAAKKRLGLAIPNPSDIVVIELESK
ncbi:MAG: hypothetical protein CVU80_01835 [Elusimicrobia bacterium HGW-Elusimicrobia-4]|nr:MAG: hypothetical protein CVU80_01835 [Elusimicrobia bacterium HGW-Elusimicrobia-4]